MLISCQHAGHVSIVFFSSFVLDSFAGNGHCGMMPATSLPLEPPPSYVLSDELQLLGDHHEARNPILEGILFSLDFVVTFQWVLLGLVFVLTLYHHVLATRSSKPHNTSHDDIASESFQNALTTPEVTYSGTHYGTSSGNTRDTSNTSISSQNTNKSSTSSTSSTSISSQMTVKKEIVHESTPLLHKQSRGRRFPAWWDLLVRKWRAIIIYHPVSKKELPGNDTSAFVLLLLAVNLFYTFYCIPLTRPLIYILADRSGLLFVCNLPWLYLLSAKNQPFRLLTGTSYESLNILHRGLGKWLTMLAFIHVGGMVLVWYDFLLPRGLDVWWYLQRHIIWTGLVAFSCYMLLTLTSRPQFRERFYEVFLACHIVMQAGGLLFLFLHHHRALGNVGLALFIFLIDRLAYRWAAKTRTFDADLAVMEDGETIMVSSSWTIKPGRVKPFNWIFGQSLRRGWDASNHVFLSVPAIALKHRIQAHPFTIASAAPQSHQDHAWLKLIIRARDGFTRELLEYARLHTSAKVIFDGPYGSPHAYHMLARNDAALIVAGGSGIAVAYPLLWQLLHERSQPDHNGERTPANACLIWVVHDESHMSWIGRERLAELENMGLQLTLPPPTGTAGRPDIPALVRDTVSRLSGPSSDGSVAVVVSGPDAMNRSVRNTCSSLAWSGLDVHVAVEVFDW